MNLGTALALKGNKVLLVDLDPQGNLSNYLGFEEDEKTTVSQLMMEIAQNGSITKEDFQSAIRHSKENKVDFMPSDINLANADFYLAGALSRETVLKRMLGEENIQSYDYVIVDCLPSLGVLLMNALAASDGIIIPVQTQKFALLGLSMLNNVVEQISATINPKLKLIGVLPTMADNTNMTRNTMEKLNETYGEKMFGTVIHKSIEAANSTEQMKSLCLNKSKLGDEYKIFAEEVMERVG